VTMQFANTISGYFKNLEMARTINQSMGVMEPILGCNRFWEVNSATEKSSSEM